MATPSRGTSCSHSLPWTQPSSWRGNWAKSVRALTHQVVNLPKENEISDLKTWTDGAYPSRDVAHPNNLQKLLRWTRQRRSTKDSMAKKVLQRSTVEWKSTKGVMAIHCSLRCFPVLQMFSSFAIPLEPSIHGGEIEIAPVKWVYHFKHPPARVFCATYLLQVLWR